jgi:transcriptional regulator with XRE-family HTH domain
MTNAERIRAWQQRRGIPTAELARRAGVSRRTLYNLLEGMDSNLDTLIGVAKALEVPLAEIAPDAAARVAEVA